MDIEGSEFALFGAPEWLARVRRLGMEVHRDYGEPGKVLDTLSQHGFSVRMADGDLVQVERPDRCDFIYAWR